MKSLIFVFCLFAFTISEKIDEQKVWNSLKNIVGEYGAAGIMGNIYSVSGFQPNNLQDSYNKKLNMTDEELDSKGCNICSEHLDFTIGNYSHLCYNQFEFLWGGIPIGKRFLPYGPAAVQAISLSQQPTHIELKSTRDG